MAIHPKEGKLIYHLTSLKNIEGIIQYGLKPRDVLAGMFDDIADLNILDSRNKYILGKCVPFHFISKSPFAGAVQINNGHTEFVYVTLSREYASKNGFQIIPRHPCSYNDEPLEWNVGIDKIDWETFALRDYHDHDSKEVCMAEATYRGVIPPKAISVIFVRSKETHSLIIQLLKKYGLLREIAVSINKEMFVVK